MSEEFDDIQNEELEEQVDQEIELTEEEDGQGGGKFNRLLESDSRKYKLSGMFKDWFLDYSSYVILERAVPHIVDGLKPVQRRVLHAMYRMDDGNYTKVANIVGQAMQYHPHGDQSILGALVQLGQKNLTVDCQGNWGNILTGDSNAAPRYIEARLSKFAKEVVFDPDITNWMNSYDGRNKEPMELPVRFPLLLAQGTEGIAVGMASKILPHNFNELLDASVRILEGKSYELYPDFPTGGFADCSKYNQGRRGGSVSDSHPLNASYMFVRLDMPPMFGGEVICLQFLKQLCKVVTFTAADMSGGEVSDSHPLNVLFSAVTLDGIAGAASMAEHPLKHSYSAVPLVSDSATGNDGGPSTSDVQPLKHLNMPSTPLGIAGASTSDVQPSKQLLMLVASDGSTGERVSDSHPLNRLEIIREALAESAPSWSLLGMVADSRDGHPLNMPYMLNV